MSDKNYKAKYAEALEGFDAQKLREAYDTAFYSECDRLLGAIKEECSKDESIANRTASLWVEGTYPDSVVKRVAEDLKNIGFTVQIATMKAVDPTFIKPASIEISW